VREETCYTTETIYWMEAFEVRDQIPIFLLLLPLSLFLSLCPNQQMDCGSQNGDNELIKLLGLLLE
jgi:hypothetical protein